jgi:uncharacterized damage-inducible protein DinB
MEVMQTAPARYRELVAQLPAGDLARTYREGSWTVRQLVHHVADIQSLNFLRLKKALTEADSVAPLVEVNGWAAATDTAAGPVEDSLLMLEGITRRYVFLARTLNEETLGRTFYHPARQMHFDLRSALHLTAWHTEHHLAHIHIALGLAPQPFRIDW